MGRRTTKTVGQRKGHLEIIDILPQNKSGRHVQLEVLCHACNKTVLQSSVIFAKSKSCGCERNKAGVGKTFGAKTMPWQLEKGESARRLLVARYKRTAKTRGLEFTLTENEINLFFKAPCNYCDKKETNVCKGLGKSSGDYAYVGLDRVDPHLGYVKGNVVSCCWLCNMMKNTLTKGAFMEHVILIYKHSVGAT